MNINRKQNILTYIISVSFILMTFLGVVHICCFDENFYTKEHEKITLYGKHINEHIGISNEDLQELTSFTLDYLNDPNATLDKKMTIKGKIREVFTDDEKLHMVDVRKLNLAFVYICIFSFIIFSISMLIYIFDKFSIYLLYKNYLRTLLYTLLFFGILGFWILLDFDSFWTFFHKIFFTGNELWILDLRKDILIMIVPPEFFNDLVIRILLSFVLSILLFGLLLFIIKRKKIVND